MRIRYRKKELNVPVKKVFLFGKLSGLMFRTKNTKNLLFEFSRKTRTSLHSIFVFFKFLVLWLDAENNVLDWKIINPFRLNLKSKKTFSKIIEIPLNSKNREIIKFFVAGETFK